MKKTYKIQVDCANCANKAELAAQKNPGVKSATVNFMMQKLIVEFEETANPQEVFEVLRKNCRKASHDFEFLG